MFKSFDESIGLLRLGPDPEMESHSTNDNNIELRKIMGKLSSKSRKDAKIKECLYCGKNCSSFCNSHSIPAFILRNIAVDGDLYTSNKLGRLPGADQDKGVNDSGTFQIICRKCDSEIFSDYENPANYVDTPNSKMIAQIAMKNFLKSISKRKFEIAFNDNTEDIIYDPTKQQQLIKNLDLQEFIKGFNRAKRIAEKGWDNEYYLFYQQRLDYVVPIAFQNNVALIFDFDGYTINDIYNLSPTYEMQYIHICVFPLENSSIIMMFVDSKYKRYRSFRKQFNRLSDEERLTAINFIIFSYSEDVFLNKKLSESVLKHKMLVEVIQKTPKIKGSTLDFNLLSTLDLDPLSIARKDYDFSKMNEIPNLLLEDYKVR